MDIEAIAKRLTPAQVGAMLSSADIPDACEAWGVKQTRKVLIDMGLCNGPLGRGWSFNFLTATGLAVRDYLIREGK